MHIYIGEECELRQDKMGIKYPPVLDFTCTYTCKFPNSKPYLVYV